MKTIAFALLLFPTVALAQDAAEVRRLFEAGQYQQVIQSADAGASPEALYTAAQSHQKLGSAEEARSTYARLAELPEDNPWHFIGVSGQQLLDDNTDAALESARQAVQMSDNIDEAHYQVGLVLAKRQDWRGAAEAFERAAAAESRQRLRALLRRVDAVPRGPPRSHGEPLRAVPEAGARSAGAARKSFRL